MLNELMEVNTRIEWVKGRHQQGTTDRKYKEWCEEVYTRGGWRRQAHIWAFRKLISTVAFKDGKDFHMLQY